MFPNPKFDFSMWMMAGLFFAILFGLKCLGAEFGYVPRVQRDELRAQFDQAKPMVQPIGAWVCNLYGVSSGLQTAEGLHLYSFERKSRIFLNHGSNVVSLYSLGDGRMLGTNGTVRDELRMTKSKNLISRLTHVNSGTVVAYSVCKSSP